MTIYQYISTSQDNNYKKCLCLYQQGQVEVVAIFLQQVQYWSFQQDHISTGQEWIRMFWPISTLTDESDSNIICNKTKSVSWFFQQDNISTGQDISENIFCLYQHGQMKMMAL
jgi:hypothetical protein